MKNKKINSEIDLMIVIVDRHKGHNVCEILNQHQAFTHVNCIGQGTSESGIADLFGFGIKERDIVLSLVRTEKSEKILKLISEKFNLSERHNGLALTVPLNSIERNLLNLINQLEVKNG